jgi:hypothetical protein
VAAACERAGGDDAIVALRRSDPCDADALAAALRDRLAAIALDVLATLYPDADSDVLPPARRSADNARPAE